MAVRHREKSAYSMNAINDIDILKGFFEAS
jgi:hypothetical protein